MATARKIVGAAPVPDRGPDRVPAPGAAAANVAAALVAIAVAAWVDWATGKPIGLGIFYLVPVAVVAWTVGRFAGLAMATLASLAWLAVDLDATSPELFTVSLWNGFTRLCIGLLVVVLLAGLRSERRALQQANQRLLASNQDLDAFAARVAHDLRNALAPLGSLPAVLRHGPLEAVQRDELARMLQNSQRNCMRIIDALLALARTEQVADPDEHATVATVLDDVLAELAPAIERLQVAVAVQVPAKLDVRCTPGLLHIVLANVVGNAVKFLDGSPVRRVEIAARTLAGEACIEIGDTGPGIPESEQARIFQAFYRGDGATVQGTGIGLATVERIVHARGGRVSVESSPGHGTTLRIALPLA